MKTFYNSLTLVLFISLFISCEKKDSESKPSTYSYLNEPGFIKNGLIGYYPFNGDLKDYSGHANNATVHSNFSVDPFNYSAGAVHFNGINRFITIPNFGKSLKIMKEQLLFGVELILPTQQIISLNL